jgi:hypothetical protein
VGTCHIERSEKSLCSISNEIRPDSKDQGGFLFQEVLGQLE